MHSSSHRVLIATRSSGKLRELVPWFSAVGVSAETLDDAGLGESSEEDALEAFDTFEANALAKARWFHARSGGRVVIAEDSGVEVDALDGAPGVYSKRWSSRPDLEGVALDDANNAHMQLMLQRAAALGRTSRRAQYVCAAACVWPGGEHVVRGVCDGVILDAPRGAHGFGYDPYFLSADLHATFGEVTRDAKAAVSHRARAFAALLSTLPVSLRALLVR
jgi:XTP/dITP diphosphohydrolase